VGEKEKKRVLFVDDDQNILQGMRRVMWSLRDTLHTEYALSAQEALAKMREQPFDIVISDMRMPKMDGADFLDEVRTQFPQIIRIVLSGHSDEKMIFRSLGSAHQYLAKPCKPEIVQQTINRACAIQDLLEGAHLRKIVTGIATLPSLPSLYAELLEEVNNTEGSIERISHIISQDMALCVKMLQLVNSAFFGLSRQLSSTQDAVNHLGFDTVKTLALAVKVFESFNINPDIPFSMEATWYHSLQTGAFARAIALSEEASAHALDQSMTAGMLHDLGKLVIATYLPDSFLAIQQHFQEQHITDWQAEEYVLGTTHSQIGAYLLGTWGLPSELVESVLFHHQPVDTSFPTLSPPTFVYAANFLSHQGNKGWPGGGSLYDIRTLENQYGQERVARWEEACHLKPQATR